MLDLSVRHLDILGTPRRYFFELLSYFATKENEKERLEYFSSMEGTSPSPSLRFTLSFSPLAQALTISFVFYFCIGQDDFRKYNHRERRTFIEVLQDFPSSRPPLDYLFDLLPPLLSRPFSISSSPSLYPSRIHVTAAIVRFTTPSRRLKVGVCSTWLANLPRIITKNKIK
jgi:sulfite reductase alpha subunit-like flavoprotein